MENPNMEKLDTDFTGGILTESWFDHEGKLHIHKRADIEPNVEYAKAIRNDPGHWDAGVEKSFAHAGHIPAITCVELLKIGVDVNRASLKEIRAGLVKIGKEHFIWGS